MMKLGLRKLRALLPAGSAPDDAGAEAVSGASAGTTASAFSEARNRWHLP